MLFVRFKDGEGNLPAQRTVDFAVLVFGSDALCAERVETDQDARVVVIVLAQKAQQRVASGRGLVAGHHCGRRAFCRCHGRFRHRSRQTAAIRRRHHPAAGSCAVLRQRRLYVSVCSDVFKRGVWEL